MEEVRLLHLQLPTYRHFHLLIYDEEHKNQHFEISLSYLHQFKKEGNKLQRQKILSFIYPIYNHNWRNISTVYIYNKTSIKRNILTIKQNTSEVGRAKNLSAPLYRGC